VKLSEAVGLIRPAIATPGGTWADFGAGTGVFTRALAKVLGPGAKVIAIDHDARAIATLEESSRAPLDGGAGIVPVRGDFQDLDFVNALAADGLDGALFANALHFAPDAGRVLAHVGGLLRGNGNIVVVEYDRRPASRWVPYPVARERLRTLAAQASLSPPRIVGELPSAFGGVMYCATMERASE
jgi:SAM-dependent methyltransferase